jgi:hypothetical protein
MCLNKPVTKELTYSLLRENHFRNMVSKPDYSMFKQNVPKYMFMSYRVNKNSFMQSGV